MSKDIWIPQVGEYVIMEQAGGWGYSMANNGCIAIITETHGIGNEDRQYPISGTVLNPAKGSKYNDFVNIPIKSSRYTHSIVRKAELHEIPIKFRCKPISKEQKNNILKLIKEI